MLWHGRIIVPFLNSVIYYLNSMTETPVIASETDAAVVGRFRAPSAMYAGASIEAVAKLMAEGIVRHVPATSPIAGDNRRPDVVLSYLRRLAGRRLRVTRKITKRARS
jgi:hypothetical protein